MENKKGFLLYADIETTVKKLNDEYAGKLFKLILAYVNDQNPTTEDILLEVAFEPIKQQLKRDLDKWTDIKTKRSIAGKISAEKKKQQKATKSTNVKSVKQKVTHSTVSVNDNVNVNVNVKKDIYKRRDIFKDKMKKYASKYPKDMLNSFYLYWTEANSDKSKMRFEKQEVFEIGRRLSAWSRRSDAPVKSNNGVDGFAQIENIKKQLDVTKRK